jgi:hypothetical protein
MHNYSECYATLGVTPDTDWKTLRAEYKRLIGRWHPDRFLSDAARKEIAEEQCKRITLAYAALKKYRREHGVLPLMASQAAIAETKRPAHDLGASFAPVAPDRPSDTTAERAANVTATRRKPQRRHRTAIVLAVLAAAIVLFDRDLELAPPRDKQAVDPGPSPSTPAPIPSPRESGGFSIGSTLGEVYSIQGVPTLTRDGTWYYGKSEIRFERGRVVSWREHPDNPLRVAPDQPLAFFGDRHFDVGSTKEEVRELQGVPMSESDSVWSYGPSKVYFERDRVVRWEADPLHPLRVPR